MELKNLRQILWERRWLALAAFLATLMATVVFTFAQRPTYQATATFVLVPTGASSDMRNQVDSPDTASRRAEVAGTYAQIAASPVIKREAADELGLSEAQRDGLYVSSELKAGTNRLEITVEGSNPQFVRLFANTVGAMAVSYVENLNEAWGLSPLEPATLPTSPTKPNTLLNLFFGVVLGLVLGAALAFLVGYVEAPMKPAISPGAPAVASTTIAEARGENGEVLEGLAVSDTATQPGSRPARLRPVGLIVAAILALAVIAGGTAVWLSGLGTSAAALPSGTPTMTLASTAIWTSTAEASPTNTALPRATPSQGPSPTPCVIPSEWLVYVVGADDTLYSLAVKFGMSMAEIIGRNCLTRDEISAGQVLYLPPLPQTQTPTPSATVRVRVAPTRGSSPIHCIRPEGWTTIHIVQAGDSLYSLALTYGVSVKEIMEANCLTSSRLSGGQQALYLPRLPQTPTPTAVATGRSPVTPTSTVTSTPPVTPTSSTALTATATAMPFLTPALLAPPDRQDFSEYAQITLAWQAVGELPADTYYVITVAYSHLEATWHDDVPWTRDTSWTLSEHPYLLDLSDDGQFRWSVQVMRQTGVDDSGKPTGEPLSPPSEVRTLTWRRVGRDSERAGPGATPKPPPP